MHYTYICICILYVYMYVYICIYIYLFYLIFNFYIYCLYTNDPVMLHNQSHTVTFKFKMDVCICERLYLQYVMYMYIICIYYIIDICIYKTTIYQDGFHCFFVMDVPFP